MARSADHALPLIPAGVSETSFQLRSCLLQCMFVINMHFRLAVMSGVQIERANWLPDLARHERPRSGGTLKILSSLGVLARALLSSSLASCKRQP
jgi:hypothetical protein